MEKLLTIAAEYGIQVKTANLAPELKGFYYAKHNTIYLSRRLTTIEQRCTLAHELGHAYWGHTCTTTTTENQANSYACRALINPEEYARAENITSTIEDLADELNVLPEVILHYQKYALQRLGNRTYAREAHHQRIA